MAKNTAFSEDEIVDWLVELIMDNKLLEVVYETDQIYAIKETFNQSTSIPAFGFDHLSRRASVRAAATVLDNLSLLEIISVNKSISLTTGEILRPDILCFNPETRAFVVFEVKRDKLTERQAVTELAGYEQELRNALPFIGGCEVNFVVVSTHWDQLLDHAVANYNTWSAKHCLALKVEADARPFSLTCHIPQAWQIRGGVGLPDDALQTIDLCLYEEGDEEASSEVPQQLFTAMEAIARSGDRLGSHGFALLWRDSGNIGNGRWAITLCGIDPIAMHTWCSKTGIATRPSALTQYVEKHALETPMQVPSNVYRSAKEAFQLMGDRYRPTFENSMSWGQKLETIRHRSKPVYFEFWGALGDYAREFVSHPGVRDRYLSFIEQDGFDWHHPVVAAPLLGNICSDVPFPQGVVRCRGAFEAGIVIGLFESLARSADESDQPQAHLESFLDWAILEVIRVYIEMCEIYRTADEVNEPPPPISSNREKRAYSADLLSKWVLEHLIGDSQPIHQICYEIGRAGAPCLSEWLDDASRDTFSAAHAEGVVTQLRIGLANLVSHADDFESRYLTSGSFSKFLRRIGFDMQSPLPAQVSKIDAVPAMDLLSVFQSIGVDGLDEIIPAVLHTTGPLPSIDIDWDGLQQSACALFKSGVRWPTVIVSQGGQFGIGELQGLPRQLLQPIADPQREVYFVDEKAAFSLARRVTWVALKSEFKGDSEFGSEK
jgi:hypothetical protein